MLMLRYRQLIMAANDPSKKVELAGAAEDLWVQ
jgi:hypothetical protein